MKDKGLQFVHNATSTNRLLADMAQKRRLQGNPLSELFVLAADFQTEGRGAGASKWFSDKDENLLLSIYFEPPLAASKQFVFNQYFALATREFVSRHADGAQIKWPNDIYVHGKKIAGDLTEHTIVDKRILFTIAGIGININQAHFPDNIPHPTSLFLETGQKYPLHVLLEEYTTLLRQQYAVVDMASAGILHDSYLQHLYRYDEFHPYLIHQEKMDAAIKDIDPFGRLILSDRSGKIHTCGFKEIVFL